MDEIDKFFQQPYYYNFRILMRITGLWPCDSNSRRWTIYILYLLILGSGLTFEVLGMVEVRADFFEMIDCIPLLFLVGLTLMQTSCIIFALPKIKILLNKMKEHWYAPKSKDETQILYASAIFGQRISYFCTFVLLGENFIYVTTPLLSKYAFAKPSTEMEANNTYPMELLYHANYMVDPQVYFLPIYFHMAICMAWHILLLTVVDVLYVTLVQHCCGLFEILRHRFENAFEFQDDRNNDLTMTFARGEFYSYIVHTIRKHTEALQFTSSVESVYTVPLLSYAGFNIVATGVVGFQALHTNNKNRLMRYSLHLSGSVFNTFFMHWQGQRIIDYSGKIYEAAYNMQWHKMPIATKRLLILIMMRSIKPSQLTAGKMMAMSYVNFNAVTRLSLSYLTLLRSFQ